MAKMELRVSFKGAPAAYQKQIFGEAKNSAVIKTALKHFEGQAHEQEIFYFLNTDAEGSFLPTIDVPMANLKKQLSTMVLTDQIKRHGGERSARYALLEFEGVAPDDEDETDEESADAE